MNHLSSTICSGLKTFGRVESDEGTPPLGVPLEVFHCLCTFHDRFLLVEPAEHLSKKTYLPGRLFDTVRAPYDPHSCQGARWWYLAIGESDVSFRGIHPSLFVHCRTLDIDNTVAERSLTFFLFFAELLVYLLVELQPTLEEVPFRNANLRIGNIAATQL